MQIHIKAVLLGDLCVNQGRAYIRMSYPAFFSQLFDDRFHIVDGDGKTDAFHVGYGDLRAVDTDDLAVCVHQRAAGVTGIDGCVGLEQGEFLFTDLHGAVQGGNDAHRYTAAKFHAQRVADSDGRFAHLHGGRIAELCHGQVIQINFYNGQVCRRVGTQHFTGSAAAVRKAHDNF